MNSEHSTEQYYLVRDKVPPVLQAAMFREAAREVMKFIDANHDRAPVEPGEIIDYLLELAEKVEHP